MAEALAWARYGALAHAQSAGSLPSRVNPYEIEVLAERGLDLSTHSSKPVAAIDPTGAGRPAVYGGRVERRSMTPQAPTRRSRPTPCGAASVEQPTRSRRG
jgi:hypothetical protein